MLPLLPILFFLMLLLNMSLSMGMYSTTDMLEAKVMRPYMFTIPIDGSIHKIIPTLMHLDKYGRVTGQYYQIQMVKSKQQILPEQLFNATTFYTYKAMTAGGYMERLLSLAVVVQKNTLTKIKWINEIAGPHILPVDTNYPFRKDDVFKYAVPVCPHVHGVATNQSSDGLPECYWTINGEQGPMYQTQEECQKNAAIFTYPNEQDSGNNWFHDHTFGITRLNVYAGMAGLYKITDSADLKERKIVQEYGEQVSEDKTKYLIISDKSFKKNGELFYPEDTMNPSFKYWVPEFFGNMFMVNGVLWPKMNLKQQKYRFVFLNACQSRYLNIWFETDNKTKVPIQLIRIDSDFFPKTVVVEDYLATIASRIQFILDLSNITGNITLRNDAVTPFPNGDSIDPEFEGQIMKIIMQPKISPLNTSSSASSNTSSSTSSNSSNTSDIQQNDSQKKGQSSNQEQPLRQDHTSKDSSSQSQNQEKTRNLSQEPQDEPQGPKYPTFDSQGNEVFMTLIQALNDDDQLDAGFIDGMVMEDSMDPQKTNVFEANKTYDIHIINLTPDAHPMHLHLVHFQKVYQYPFDEEEYLKDYTQLNEGKPTKHGFIKKAENLDPEPYRKGQNEMPLPHEKIFRDTIDTWPGYVTVIRVRFSRTDGRLWNNIKFKDSLFVIHCHILEHQDNQMMKYFVVKYGLLLRSLTDHIFGIVLLFILFVGMF